VRLDYAVSAEVVPRTVHVDDRAGDVSCHQRADMFLERPVDFGSIFVAIRYDVRFL
jgi:hypothetical protein